MYIFIVESVSDDTDGSNVLECFQEYADAVNYCNAQGGWTIWETPNVQPIWVGESQMDYLVISTYRLWGAGESVDFTHDGPTV